jgi:hypothetical protein
MMNDIFVDLIAEGRVVVYLDDILIYLEHLEDHRATVKEVLWILQENKLFLKPEKSEFEQREVKYLGVIVGDGKIRMDPIKVEGVQQWATPRNIKDIQSFLGFLNFYQHFIKGFGDYAKALTHLTRKDYKWRWGELEKKVFNQLTLAVTSEPILHFPTAIGLSNGLWVG